MRERVGMSSEVASARVCMVGGDIVAWGRLLPAGEEREADVAKLSCCY